MELFWRKCSIVDNWHCSKYAFTMLDNHAIKACEKVFFSSFNIYVIYIYHYIYDLQYINVTLSCFFFHFSQYNTLFFIISILISGIIVFIVIVNFISLINKYMCTNTITNMCLIFIFWSDRPMKPNCCIELQKQPPECSIKEWCS